jgi:hypothetical protein
MRDNGIAGQMYCPVWFLTAFQTMDWPPDLQLRIYDRFLFFGLRGLLSFALMIVKEHESQLVDAPIEEMLPLLQHPDRSPRMHNWREVFRKWDKLWIRQGEYDKLFLAIGEKVEPVWKPKPQARRKSTRKAKPRRSSTELEDMG